jgi:TonB family protein
MMLGVRRLAGIGVVLTALAGLHAAPAAAQSVPAPAPERKPCAGPEYPPEARRYELEGITTLRFRIATDGRVHDAAVARSSGWALLDGAAIRTLQACTFPADVAARSKGEFHPMKYVWSLEGNRIRPQLVPGSCPATGRFASFQPYDNAPTGPDGVKVRLLVDPAGQPRGVKLEGASLPPNAVDALVKYVESCRFGFDPTIRGERTDTAYGRVMLR